MSDESVDEEWSYTARRMEFTETSWLVERIGDHELLPLVGGGLVNLQLSYNMSKQYCGVRVVKYDCRSDLPDGIMDVDIFALEYMEDFNNVTINVELNTSEIITSDIYTEQDGEGGFAFCLRGELYVLGGDDISNSLLVNFDETLFNITVGMSGEFSLGDHVDLERQGPGFYEQTMDYDEFVEVYQCDENRDELASVEALSQGSILTVCAASKDPSVVIIDQIMELKLTQGINEFIAIESGVETYDSLVTSDGADCVDGICMVQMMLVGKFFVEDDPDDVDLTGRVKLSIPDASAGRRFLEVSPSERGLETTEGSFELEIKVKSASQTDSSSGYKIMPSMFIVAGLLYLVMG